MKGKRLKIEKKSNLIAFLLMIIFLAMMIFSGYKIIMWLKENRENSIITEKLKDTISIDGNIQSVEKYSVDFGGLKQQNPDTVGWLKVNGTNIEYPVVQTTNNDYYMTHTYDKKYNSSGWVFMDYRNKGNDTDKNMIIYAHNRRDGSMFGTLKNILKEEWQETQENHVIPFITENEKKEYQVFSVYKIEAEDYYITTNFKGDKDFKNFIDKIKARSVKDFGVDVTTENQILTLSTCADDNRYRVVLHAKK